MVSQKSNATRMLERVMEMYRDFKDAQIGEEDIPFMHEKLSRRSASSRVRDMTPTQKKALIEKIGIDEVMKIVRRGQS